MSDPVSASEPTAGQPGKGWLNHPNLGALVAAFAIVIGFGTQAFFTSRSQEFQQAQSIAEDRRDRYATFLGGVQRYGPATIEHGKSSALLRDSLLALSKSQALSPADQERAEALSVDYADSLSSQRSEEIKYRSELSAVLLVASFPVSEAAVFLDAAIIDQQTVYLVAGAEGPGKEDRLRTSTAILVRTSEFIAVAQVELGVIGDRPALPLSFWISVVGAIASALVLSLLLLDSRRHRSWRRP